MEGWSLDTELLMAHIKDWSSTQQAILDCQGGKEYTLAMTHKMKCEKEMRLAIDESMESNA